MTLPMRRSDREVKDQGIIDDVLRRATVCRLGMIDGDVPYVVPLCFGYDGSALYFHGAIKGRKMNVLRVNPKVCFEFDLIADPREAEEACDWGMCYQSIIGFGSAVLLDELEDKRRALDVIMAQYSDKTYHYPENMLKATAVIKVVIESMSCKQEGL